MFPDQTTPGSFDQTDVAPASGGGAEQLPDPLPADPFPLFLAWFEEAHRLRAQPNPNAMTLATVDPDRRPSARMVLCKGIDGGAGSLDFYTNYTGRKGAALEAHPWAALVFHWDALDRQVRIEGPVTRLTEAESDAYFATRPWESRIGAWSSQQSRPVGSRRELLERVDAAMRRFGIDPAHLPAPGSAIEIPRPPNWGGYRVLADRVELWASGRGRVHDRAQWMRVLTPEAGGYAAGAWTVTRLQP